MEISGGAAPGRGPGRPGQLETGKNCETGKNLEKICDPSCRKSTPPKSDFVTSTSWGGTPPPGGDPRPPGGGGGGDPPGQGPPTPPENG